MKFYPADWSADTAPLSLAARGAWITIVCAMWRAEERGTLCLTKEGYCRLLGADEEQTIKVIDELVENHICNEVLAGCDEKGVTGRNKNITLVCRRMEREYKLHKNNALRQERYRVTHQGNAPVTGEKSEVRSQKSEIRSQNKEKNKSATQALLKFVKPTPGEVTEYAKSKGIDLNGEQFCNFYESKGWLVGKAPMRNWRAAVTGTWKHNRTEKQDEATERRRRKAESEYPEQISVRSI